EVDLDLVQPARVHRRVDWLQGGPASLQASVALGATVGRAVVHDPEDTLCRAVGLLRHDLLDEPVEGRDATPPLASSKQAGLVAVPRGQIGPGALPAVLVLDALRLAGGDGHRRMAACPGLDAGFLIGRDHVLARAQRLALPPPRIEIKNDTGPLGEP